MYSSTLPTFYLLHFRLWTVCVKFRGKNVWIPEKGFFFFFGQWASSEDTKPATEHVFCFRALSDIYESIKELQFYKSSIFKVSAEAPLSKIVENGGSNNC